MEINLNALVEYKKEETVYVKNSMESYRLDLFNCFLLKTEIRNIVISAFLYFFS